MSWDPAQYLRFSDERGRPFIELLARVDADSPRRAVDLGCGTGELTTLLAARWPSAHVTGLDSSAEMIAHAQTQHGTHVKFVRQSIETWMPDAETDIVISNAALQWVPTHRELLRAWMSALPPGASLAWQVPGNFDAPSHALMRKLASSPRWRDKLDGVLRHSDAVGTLDQYAQLALRSGLSVDAWETTYLHRLHGEDPVLQWVRGTGLRPVLSALAQTDATLFEREYAALLREAYPADQYGVSFAFRRMFVVARKRA